VVVREPNKNKVSGSNQTPAMMLERVSSHNCFCVAYE